MWVILAINLVFAWIMFEILASASSCQGMTGDDLDACQAGEGIGKTALVLIVLFIWALVDIVLAVLFLVTRGRQAPPTIDSRLTAHSPQGKLLGGCGLFDAPPSTDPQDDLLTDHAYALNAVWNIDKHRRLPEVAWTLGNLVWWSRDGAADQWIGHIREFAPLEDGTVLGELHNRSGSGRPEVDPHLEIEIVLADDPSPYKSRLWPAWKVFTGRSPVGSYRGFSSLLRAILRR
jgi:hypothetical protein